MAALTKTVVVTGATGALGGGLVDALLSAGTKKIRGITRSSSSKKAKDLAAKGVEVVEANLGNKASLSKAFTGADELFLVTDFFAAGASYDGEFQQGKNAVDAAKEAGIKFVVFSALEGMPTDVKEKLPSLGGGLTVAHFESKNAVSDYLAKSGLSYALLRPCNFYENMINFTFYQKQDDGSYAFSDNMGTAPHAWHSVSTIGLTAAAILEDPSKYKGKSVPAVGEHIGLPAMAQIVSDVTGKTVKYAPVSDEVFASLPIPGAQNLANMNSYYKQWSYYDDLRPMSERVATGPTFKEWAEAHSEALKAKLA